METLKLKALVKKNGHITIDIPTGYKTGEVELVIVLNRVLGNDNVQELSDNKYDFSKFSNKLKWKGDAIKEQRKLRDEWK